MSSVKDLLRGDVVDGSGTANYIPKFIDTNTIGNSAIYESGGNIGIGTSSPDAKLQVGSNGYVKIDGVNSATPGSLKLGYGTDYSEILVSNFGGNLVLRADASNSKVGSYMVFDVDGSERMRIKSDGNMTLNTVVYNNTVGAGVRILYIDNAGGIGGVSSTRASKTNITDASTANWIYDLNPVEFNYRKKDEEGNYTDEFYDDKQIGLIAEEAQPVADFLINYKEDEDGTKEMIGIEYSRLIIPMLKAIQELRAEVESLKSE